MKISQSTIENENENDDKNRSFKMYKTTGRDVQPTWSHRIVKDINDLHYNPNWNFVKPHTAYTTSPSPSHSKSRRQNFLNNGLENTGQSFNHIFKAIKKFHHEKGNNKIKQMQAKLNPQILFISKDKQYNTDQTNGLCKFQFMKTIQGKIKFGNGKHLKFQFQRGRRQNINPVWNNNFSVSLPIKKMQNLKVHEFKSYTPRQVFKPKAQLDKIYNTTQIYKRCHRNIRARIVKKNPGTQNLMKYDALKYQNNFSFWIQQKKQQYLTFQGVNNK